MTKPFLYSKTKFLSFSPEQQVGALNKLILAVETKLADNQERGRIISHIFELSELVSEPLPIKLQLFLRELHDGLSPHQILNKLYIYHEGALRKDSQLAIRTGDGNQVPDPQLRHKATQITLICDNLRSVFNVGSLFRTAECLGLGKILLCGISPTPEHSNMEKTAMGTQSLVPWECFSTTEDAINYCRALNYKIYALETLAEAQNVFSASYELPLALLIGNESLGIEPKLLPLCDAYLSLPQLGWKNSLNVGVAAAITLYNIMFGA